MDPRDWILWGSELSPFALKVEALLRFAGLPHRWLPANGTFREGLRARLRVRAVVRGRLPLTFPEPSALDEFPLVPFLLGPGGENLYDSSAIGRWLARRGGRAADLVPGTDPALGFAVSLVDEALDELGLYLVHHNRWVVSARDNDAGRRLAREMRPLLGPLAAQLARSFPARQVRRLPYLFSVAEPDGAAVDDLPRRLRPPARPGFPSTHALLDEAFAGLLAALEPVLSQRPYLFGTGFTLADASLYGQLGMNRSDPAARARMAEAAPCTLAWLDRLAAGDFAASAHEPALALDGSLAPLLGWICELFVPLMQQNERAYLRHASAGETRFNEAGFDAGRALYDGTLRGRPFRSVAKTFQVRVWRDLRRAFAQLPEEARIRLRAQLPERHGLDEEA